MYAYVAIVGSCLCSVVGLRFRVGLGKDVLWMSERGTL